MRRIPVVLASEQVLSSANPQRLVDPMEYSVGRKRLIWFGAFMPDFNLQLSSRPVFEVGGALLTVLASPQDLSYESRMDQRHRALCQHYIAAHAQLDPAWARSAAVRPVYMTLPDSIVNREVAFVGKQLNRAMVVARIGLGFLKKATGSLEQLPAGLRAVSVNALAEYVIGDTQYSDAHNFEQNVWRPFQPVLHIAAAVATIIDDAARGGHSDADSAPENLQNYFCFMLRPELSAEAATRSEQYAEIMRTIPAFAEVYPTRARLQLT